MATVPLFLYQLGRVEKALGEELLELLFRTEIIVESFSNDDLDDDEMIVENSSNDDDDDMIVQNN